jgi:glucan phosphoethanolaminetransferase (alkaline phosphatase superfamily)
MGNYEGPSIALKIVLAFLLPILIFISALLISQNLWQKHFHAEKIVIVLSLFSALMFVAFYLAIARLFNKNIHGTDKND